MTNICIFVRSFGSAFDLTLPVLLLRIFLLSVILVLVMPLNLTKIEPDFYCHTSAPDDGCTRVCNPLNLILDCPHIRLEMGVKSNVWDIVVACKRNFSRNIEQLPKMQLNADYAQALMRNCPVKILNRFGNLNLSVIEVVVDDADNSQIKHDDLDADNTMFDFLDITNSTAATIDADALRSMPGLIAVVLLNNTFRSLPAGLLQPAINLDHFSVFNDRELTTFPSGFLSNLTNLNSVYFIECKLESLPGDLFTNSSKLTLLIIQGNRWLHTLPVGIFDDTPQLVELDLSGNGLRYLEDGLFRSLHALASISLDNNQLTQISSGLFMGTLNLTKMYISNNLLHSIDPDLFRSHIHLKQINLQHNMLQLNETHWSMFSTMPSLSELCLRNNSISEMPSNLFADNFKKLDLSHNQIRVAYGLTHSSRSSVTFDLSANLIEMIYPPKPHINPQKYIPMAFIYEIVVNNNPIVCNATLAKVLDRLPDLMEVGYWSLENLQCAQPWLLHGRRVMELSTSELLAPFAGGCSDNCTCWERHAAGALLVNCSSSERSRMPRLPDLRPYKFTQIELYVEHNRIGSLLPPEPATSYDLVTSLMASHNLIERLDASDDWLSALRDLDLRSNLLQTTEIIPFVSLNGQLENIWLAGNPLCCNCTALSQFLAMAAQNATTSDYLTDKCCLRNSTLLRQSQNDDLCRRPVRKHKSSEELLVWLVISLVTLVVLSTMAAVSVALYYRHRHLVRVWFFAHPCLGWLPSSWRTTDFDMEMDENRPFDAFVSYSHRDGEFVLNCLVPELEQGEPAYRMCIHERDWLAGAFIMQSIAESVARSRRTIIVLTEHFLASDWGRMEFRVAHKRALDENGMRVIVIVLGDLRAMPLGSMDAELRAYLQTNTYILWGDRWFWQKLRYAMSH